MDEQIDRMWEIYTTEYSSVVRRNDLLIYIHSNMGEMENIMLR